MPSVEYKVAPCFKKEILPGVNVNSKHVQRSTVCWQVPFLTGMGSVAEIRTLFAAEARARARASAGRHAMTSGCKCMAGVPHAGGARQSVAAL